MNDKLRGKVKALLFDLDGTLIDSKRDLVQSVNATLREMGRAELPEDLVTSYVGSGAPILISRALGEAASTEEQQSALNFFLAHYDEHKLDFTREYPGVRETLEKLGNVPMAVLTNKPVEISVLILRGLGLAGFFRAIYGGNSFATKKPDPLGANTILKELGMASWESAMVGDSEVDVQTARNAGMISAIVNFGFGTHDREMHPPDIYLDRMEELLPLVTNGPR
ncbi:MAG TPA: HAD-IA family hydrolase [Candidatus Bathyarchaeia archaeon]|nr:HAD-IA family hydrolase [Candidatus Bathyarchaeia archaeon]